MNFLFSIGYLQVNFLDILDILLVSFLLLQLYRFMSGSVAFKVIIGFIVLYVVSLIVKAANMQLLSNIFGEFTGVGIFAIIIIFQPEIRKFLLVLTRNTFTSRGGWLKNIGSWLFDESNLREDDIQIISQATIELSKSKTGALMVVSQTKDLKFVIESGQDLDSNLSVGLLMSIFFKNSPLHDGAVVIYGSKIVAARCVLPVTERTDIPPNLGLRHRAAIGVSENPEVFVLVVSEETGRITVVRNGVLSEKTTYKALHETLSSHFARGEQEKSEAKTQQGTSGSRGESGRSDRVGTNGAEVSVSP